MWRSSMALALVGVVGVAGGWPASSFGAQSEQSEDARRPADGTGRRLIAPPRGDAVLSRIEGRTTILSVVPQGRLVKKGQVVCELDSSALKDNLVNQEITVKGAEAAAQNARLVCEVAEIALKENDAVSSQELENAKREIQISEAELALAREELEAAQGKGDEAKRDRAKAELAVSRAKLTVEQANTKLRVLTQFTIPKRSKELCAELEKARMNEIAKKASVDLERAKGEKLRRQIEQCVLTAPCEGRILHANPVNNSSGRPTIDEGATVRERQIILWVVPERDSRKP